MKLTPKKGGSSITAIVGVDPILEEFERAFGDVWAPWKPVVFTGSVGMQLDVHETKDELLIKADLPGIQRDNVHITLGDGTLRIEAEKKEEKTEDGETWHMRERSFGKYSRLIETPSRRNHAAPMEAKRQQAGRKLTYGMPMSYSFFGQGVNQAGLATEEKGRSTTESICGLG
jgi:HSP20 family molecular chaperone IbpA